jgi:hypothetical protein
LPEPQFSATLLADRPCVPGANQYYFDPSSARPSGGVEQASAISLASLAPWMLGRQHAFDPFLDKLLTHARDRCEAGVKTTRNLIVGSCIAGLGGVGPRQDARTQQLPRRLHAASDQRLQVLAFLGAERDDILFGQALLRSHRIDPPANGGYH